MGEKEENLRNFERQIEDLKDRLSKNKYFARLNEKQRKHYLRGKDAFLLTQDEIVIRKGLNKEEFRCIFEFLSAQTHTLPLSFYGRQHTERGNGVHSNVEEGYTQICIELAMDYLEQGTSEMKSLVEGVSHTTGV